MTCLVIMKGMPKVDGKKSRKPKVDGKKYFLVQYHCDDEPKTMILKTVSISRDVLVGQNILDEVDPVTLVLGDEVDNCPLLRSIKKYLEDNKQKTITLDRVVAHNYPMGE